MEMTYAKGTVSSFEEAVLSKENSKQFYIIDNEEKAEELNKIMAGPLEDWRIFLHPKQLKIATSNFNGPAKILGGAGTGKTVVAMHRAKWLAEKLEPGEKILFTTFSASLADDIQANLNLLCQDKIAARIEVINLDKWIHQFYTKYGSGEKIIYGDEVKLLWKQALEIISPDNEFSLDFYESEFEKVVLANEISEFSEYRNIRRIGRGIGLNRVQKYSVWQVIEQFRALCRENRVIDGSSLTLQVKNMIQKDSLAMPYKSVIVDEAQDFGDAAFRLIRAIAGAEHENDIFIVGDAHQRIYGKKVILKNCGINTIGRSGTLKINYRTTEEIRKFSSSLISDTPADDLDEGLEDSSGYISVAHGKDPVILNFKTKTEEYEQILSMISTWIIDKVPLDSICLVTRLKKQMEQLTDFLTNNDLLTYEIKAQKKEDRSIPGIRISTMHRVKGLEFDCMIISDVNSGLVPLDSLIKSASDPLMEKELEESERLLLYVAATRAKKELCLLSCGTPSKFLSP